VWTLRYDPRVRKQLQKIKNKEVIRRIKESAERLQTAPYSGKPLRGHENVRSKRIGTPNGEYRLIYLPIKERQEVFVILVGTREEIYTLLKRSEK